MTAPMTPDEARLRELATEAKYCWPAGEWVKEHSLEQTQCLDPEDREFIAAANPDTILALLAALSAERERGDRAVAVVRYYGEDHAAPSDGPWGAFSTDFGDKARAFLATQKAEGA